MNLNSDIANYKSSVALFHGLEYFLRGGKSHDFDTTLECPICRDAYETHPEWFPDMPMIVDGNVNVPKLPMKGS